MTNGNHEAGSRKDRRATVSVRWSFALLRSPVRARSANYGLRPQRRHHDPVTVTRPGGRRAAASHPTGYSSGAASSLRNAIGVRDDMMDGRDAGEPGVCRHERLSSCCVGRCGQDRVERAEARSFPEQA